MVKAEVKIGQTYWVKWRCRDIGYGVERGAGEYIYRGREPFADKHTFEEPIVYVLEGSPRTIYLFDDEIIYCEAD
jgi:hypothetical protein